MTDVQRYIHGQDDPQPEPQNHWQPVRVHGVTHFANTFDPLGIDMGVSGVGRGSTAELNPYHGTESVFATARNKNGMPLTEVTKDTLVTIGGVQADVASFVAQGVLKANPDGTFSEATGGPEESQTEAKQNDQARTFLEMSEADMSTVNEAIAEVPQEHFDGLAATAAGFMSGKIDQATMVAKFSQASGLDPNESTARIAKALGPYQLQADAALESFGIHSEDRNDFRAWAQKNAQGEFQEAIQRQAFGHDMSGYRSLAARYLKANPPTIAAFQAAGVPVRKQGGGHEVFIAGSWMSPSAAARAGLV